MSQMSSMIRPSLYMCNASATYFTVTDLLLGSTTLLTTSTQCSSLGPRSGILNPLQTDEVFCILNHFMFQACVPLDCHLGIPSLPGHIRLAMMLNIDVHVVPVESSVDPFPLQSSSFCDVQHMLTHVIPKDVLGRACTVPEAQCLNIDKLVCL